MCLPRGVGNNSGESIRGGILSSSSSTTLRSATARTEPSVLPPSCSTPRVKRRRISEQVLRPVNLAPSQRERFLRSLKKSRDKLHRR
jgi:hypothetical protein